MSKALSSEQFDALYDYAKWAGPTWKASLLLDWQKSGSSWSGPYHLLQQVRNQFGPSWLANFSI